MIRFIPLGGFLGAGKTTTMLAAARRLEQRGERVSVITNDQGADLVDTQLARAAGFAGSAEVTGGCFCCKFDDLAAVVERLAEQVRPTVVIAEAVGSCTDLQSTVVRPLRKLYGGQLATAPLAVVLDPIRHTAIAALSEADENSDLAYLYRHQLDEADIIAVNKTDLLGGAATRELVSELGERFPAARVLAYSAATGAGLDDLIDLWTSAAPSGHTPFAIDYDRYAAAEAGLAWTNQTFVLDGAGFSPADWAGALLNDLSAAADRDTLAVGHIKVRVQTADGTCTKASLTAAGGAPSFDRRHDGTVETAQVTLNARVATAPDELEKLITAAVAAADTKAGANAGPREGDIFQPGYPRPVHRM
jgi:Ni2+-binding GTPase involved in maturation of urease and hydrogenase